MAQFLNTSFRLLKCSHYSVAYKLVLEATAVSQCRYSSRKADIVTKLGQSMILLQDGLNIQELPIIVKRTNDVTSFCQNVVESDAVPSFSPTPIVSPFKDCKTIGDILEALGAFQTEDVTAALAVQAFARIAELGQFFEYRNEGNAQHSYVLDSQKKSFTLDAVFTMLVQLVCKSQHSSHVLETLRVFALPSFPGDVTKYRVVLAEECLQRVCDGKLSVEQVCLAVKTIFSLSKLGIDVYKAQQWADQSWVGLLDSKNDDINENNILSCFQVLPCLNESRRTVFSTLERRLLSCIYKVPVDNVINILGFIKALDLPSRVICTQVSRWLSVVLHTVTEESMCQLVSVMTKLNHCDSTFCKTTERYIRAKSGQVIHQDLISEVCDYCSSFRIRSDIICSTIAEQFIKHGKSYSPRTIESTLKYFGFINYQPQNEFEFWSVAEEVLESKFITFRPDTIVDVLLSCIYLQRYPMNFIPRIFSTYFLDRLQSVQNEDKLIQLRTKLRLLDTAMTIECTQYANRMLPKDYSAKSLARDGRIVRMANSLIEPLEKLLGPKLVVSPSIVLSDLPLHGLYVVDILISPATERVYYRYGLNRSGKDAIVVLIHPAEHFSKEKTALIGPQAMRCRQMISMGFRLINLDLDVLTKYKNNPNVVQDILQHKLKQVMNI